MELDKHLVLEDNFPLDYRQDVVGDIFDLLKRSESFSFIGMKDNCKINVMRYISRRADVQTKYLGAEADKYMFVLVDLNELGSFTLPSLYHLISASLMEEATKLGLESTYLNQIFIDQPNILLKSLKEDLANVANKTGKIIVFLFNNFDQARKMDLDLVYHQLIALRNAARFSLVFIFGGVRPFEPVTFFFQKMVFMTPFSEDQAGWVLQRNCHRYQVNLTDKEKNKIIELCGGHAGLIKFCVQTLSKVSQTNYAKKITNLCNEEEIMFQCQRILSSLTDLQIAKLKTNQKDELLIKLGFQSVIDNKIKVFSPLLDTYLKSGKQSIAPFVYDKENEQLFFLGKLINNLLSKREYRLLTFMSDSPNKVFSREEIMENVWGKDEYPTDWAFDKFVSRLRKKLELDKTNRNILKTNRELGICLVD